MSLHENLRRNNNKKLGFMYINISRKKLVLYEVILLWN